MEKELIKKNSDLNNCDDLKVYVLENYRDELSPRKWKRLFYTKSRRN